MHGISPISLLQYWDVQYSSWDSLLNQLQSSNKTISYDISQKADFIFIPNGQSIMEITDNNTILMVITNDELHFLSKKQNIGEQIRMHVNQTIYSIDSITSTICALLDIPIPFENHGVMLPGLIYQNKDHKENALMLQIEDYLINAIQLYGHYVSLNKQSYFKSSYSQDLESMAETFSDLINQDEDSLKFSLLLNLHNYCLKLSTVINSEISGNLIVIGLALIFCVLSLFFYFNKYPEQQTSNIPYLAIMSIVPFIQPIVLIFYSYLTKQFSLNHLVKIVLCTTVLKFQDHFFIKYQLLIFITIYLLYESKPYLKGFVEFLANFPIQIALISSCIGLSYYFGIYKNLMLAPLLGSSIYYLQKNYSLILLVFSLSQLDEWIIVIIMLASIKTKDNLFQSIIFGYFLLLTQPTLPQSPLIYNFAAYKRIFSIFLFSILQNIFKSLQEQMNLSLTSSIDQNAFIKLIKLEINYSNYVITNAIVCTSLIVPLILVEIFSHNQEKIANQYFIFQLFLINLVYLLSSLLVQQEQEQEQELQMVVVQSKHNRFFQQIEELYLMKQIMQKNTTRSQSTQIQKIQRPNTNQNYFLSKLINDSYEIQKQNIKNQNQLNHSQEYRYSIETKHQLNH